jgi:ABC-2 type transport system ATP-binding protein
MTARLEIHDLHLQYGARPVLRGVDLVLRAGELAGLVGPNGSGKSSLMRAIAGTQPISHGQIGIDGVDLLQAPRRARESLGYAIEPERLPALLTPRQCIELITQLRQQQQRLSDSWALSEALGLSAWLDQPVHACSFGTRQKLAIVQALIGTPNLIVLDEVLNGLDPLAAYALKQELRLRSDAGAAVLLATHGLEVAERFLDRAVLLLDGRIAADWDGAALAVFRADPQGGLEHAVIERLRQAPAPG